MNQIYQEGTIPKEWQEGEIIRIYKGNGEKANAVTNEGSHSPATWARCLKEW